METGFADTLRKFRKEADMTQEKLAEALGVTTGAVYKWENGRSTPEVRLLVEMADLFGTSVDALLDYKVRSRDCAHIAECLKAAARQNPAADTLTEVEKLVRRYPNQFEIIYYSAHVYWTAGTAQHNREWSKRALELLRHSVLLVGQNTDDNISALSIQIQIAQLYAELDQRNQAINLLKAHNPMRINHAQIGNLLAISNQLDEAIPYLSDALIDSVLHQIQIADGYLNVYVRQKKYPAAIEMLNWILDGIRNLQYPNQTCFLNRTEVVYLALLAEMQLYTGLKKEAGKTLRQAKQIALRFDAEPNYALNRLRFVMPDEHTSAYDSMGETAMAGFLTAIQEEHDPELTDLWDEIENEAEP